MDSKLVGRSLISTQTQRLSNQVRSSSADHRSDLFSNETSQERFAVAVPNTLFGSSLAYDGVTA